MRDRGIDRGNSELMRIVNRPCEAAGPSVPIAPVEEGPLKVGRHGGEDCVNRADRGGVDSHLLWLKEERLLTSLVLSSSDATRLSGGQRGTDDQHSLSGEPQVPPTHRGERPQREVLLTVRGS